MQASMEAVYHKEVAPQQIQPQHSRRFHHSTGYNSSFVTTGDVPTQTVCSTQLSFACNNNNNNGVSVNGNTVSTNGYTQIPFVQIHTTDVQPQSAYNNARFRRNATSNHEIKAEPIKSENAEGAKERINATPTPPGSAQQRNETHASKNLIQNQKDICSKNGNSNVDVSVENTNVSNYENTTICTTEDVPTTFPAIHKCQHCAFISLIESGLQIHVETMHQENFLMVGNAIKRPSIQCPGCENVFFAFTVVEIHLREDHLMSEQDVMELMQAIKNKISVHDETPTKNLKNAKEIDSNDTSMNGSQRRSRIYLKNVECLREPHRDPIEQQDNLITDSLFHFENDDCNALANIGSISMEEQDLIGILTSGESTFHNKSDDNDNITNETIIPAIDVNKSFNPPKQKISIKSVDVLREPALVRRDYEMQTFDDFINVCSDLNLNVPNNNNSNNNNNNNNNNNSERSNCEAIVGTVSECDVQYNNYSVTTVREPLVGITNESAIPDFTSGYEKPRKPKIYIKNVDILKEPITFSSNLNVSNLTDSNSNVMNFNFMQPPLPQIATSYLETVESLNATVPTFNGGMSQLPLGTISDQYLFDSGGGNFLVNTTTPDSTDTYSYGNEANSDNFLVESNRFTDAITPIITEPTPPPPPPPPMATAIDNGVNSTTDMPQVHHSAALTNVQKQKIFIKNVDILKEPQYQEPRGLLHLRTVDELNLMNRKEVENLIAPNLEVNQPTMTEEDISDNFAQLHSANDEPTAVEHCSDSNVIEAISYDCEGFKLNEFSTQNSWHDDYDLGEDIRDIITSTMAPNIPTSQKIIHDLDTPQVSLISIPDMEELASGSLGVNASVVSAATSEEIALTPTAVQSQENANFTFDCEINANNNAIPASVCGVDDPIDAIAISNITLPEVQKEPVEIHTSQLADTSEALKQERLNQATPGDQSDATLPQINNTTNFGDIPPLTPMSSATYTLNTTINTATSIAVPNGLPVPPLVPMLPPIQLTKTGAATNAASAAVTPAERGRIYVANNLMQAPSAASTIPGTNAPSNQEKQQGKTPIAVSVMGGTSVRGRPFGSNRTGITKMRKQPPNGIGAGVYLKCTVTGCAFRFKKPNTLDYHIKCHSSESPPQSMACPECKAPFTNWNSLHTHLWRSHKIDMELYSCELCSFKTPIYSRLLNTHSKIHYDERNYKCDQCDKAFKNTKQLKNHRRWHRNHNKTTTSTSISKRVAAKKDDATSSESKDPVAQTSITSNISTSTTLTSPSIAARNFHRCKDCDAVFSHQKTLREHLCKNAAAAVQCEICERVLTSRSSLKLHMQSHEPSRRFKCNVCDYSASDHNAFRRHKMTHDTNAKMYACVHCDYKSIQSVAYQKHVQQKHPQVADSIVYKCKICPYATINKALFDIHQVKHENKNGKNETPTTIAAAVAVENILVATEKFCGKKITQNTVSEPLAKTKIKVKSHLLLTTPADVTMEFTDLYFDAVTVPA